VTAVAAQVPDAASQAREFLAATVDLDPGAPRAELVRLLCQYRAHLAAVVATPGG